MEVSRFLIFLFFLLFQYSLSTNVFHLQGYQILADPLGDPKDLNEIDCADECIATGLTCIGFTHKNNVCQFLTRIRDIVADYSSCFYYAVDRTEKLSDNPKTAQLNMTEKLVFSNAYGDSKCPQDFEANPTSCNSEMEENKCNEYADFFNATFVETECVVAVNQPQWYCAPKNNPERTLFSTGSSAFCYFKIKSTEGTSFAAQCQAASSKSNLVSICSTAENNFVASITTEWPLFLSLIITATQKERVYYWSDSSIAETCGYRNWQTSTTAGDDEPNDYTNNTETIVAMHDDRRWYDYRQVPTTPLTLICKEKALPSADYISQCQTLDNCEQL